MKAMILMLMVVAATARADLVDLTPGGWNWVTQTGFPPGFLQFIHAQTRGPVRFFDDASAVPWFDANGVEHPPGWVNIYGSLNGGTLFTTNVIEIAPTASASISWSFGDTGYRMGFIYVSGDNADGQLVENFYRTNGPAFKTDGSGTVTIDGVTDINFIGFFGKPPSLPLPDTGSTLLCLGIGIAALFLRFPHDQLRNSKENTIKPVGQS